MKYDVSVKISRSYTSVINFDGTPKELEDYVLKLYEDSVIVDTWEVADENYECFEGSVIVED